MSGHSSWDLLKRPDGAIPKDEYMVQYVAGYILALEDVLRDLAEFRQEVVGRTDPGSHISGLNFWDGQTMVCKQVEKSIGWVLHQARQTLEMIEKGVDDSSVD